MNKDTIIRLAREAGFERHDAMLNHPKELQRFAALVAAHEREECAKVAKAWDADHPNTNYGGCIAAAIRSRT